MKGLDVSARTRVIFMIGSPIAQARSPVLFNGHFARHDLDRVMVPLEVRPDGLGAFLETVRGAGNCDGVVLTLPLKRAAAALVDEISPRARALGSVNVIRRGEDGRLSGDMMDGPGFWNGIARAGLSPDGCRMALAGAGGAGMAIAYEFAAKGGRHIDLLAQHRDDLARMERTLAGLPTSLGWGLPASLAEHDIVVNATPVGMAAHPGTLFPPTLIETLPAHALVADAITEPLETELLQSATRRGLKTVDGYAMTGGQFELLARFLGVTPAPAA